jgi:lipopolysaccharide export system ATP-binding protein
MTEQPPQGLDAGSAGEAHPATPGARALCARGVSVRLGEKTVVSDVQLELLRGHVVGVFGPSGAGKSTLFRALVGEERVTSGSVWLGEDDVTSLPLWKRARRGLGYVPQTPSVLWDLTVAENIRVFRALGRAADLDEGLVEDLGLRDRFDVRAGSLSGGERRKLELVRALIQKPTVLVCDEPFAALDPHGRTRVAARLVELARRGFSVLLADHDVREALPMCDRAVLLLAGSVACEGTPSEFSRSPLVRTHYVSL